MLGTYLLLVVQALIVILQDWHTFSLSRVVICVGVYDVASKDILPEGKAAGWTCDCCTQRYVLS
jgi:hypothetical protein